MIKSVFSNRWVTPPGGCYEYGIGGDVVTAKKSHEIEILARELRRKHGLSTDGDMLMHVMDYMCPQLPDGFCTKPSTVTSVKSDEVKHNTALLFPGRCATPDVIERRETVCVECPKHTRRGFCVDCTGLLDWVYRGFNGKRGRFPADRALGVCLCDKVLAAAGATAAERPLVPGAGYPDNCWRLSDAKKETP